MDRQATWRRREPLDLSDKPGLTLHAQGLLSKWGFNDGDWPEEVFEWYDDRGIDLRGFNWRAVLCQLVREHLLPVIDQQVEVEGGPDSTHNPIRAIRVDGVDVEDCWTFDQPAPTLTPESVSVPWSEVLRLCEEQRR